MALTGGGWEAHSSAWECPLPGRLITGPQIFLVDTLQTLLGTSGRKWPSATHTLHFSLQSRLSELASCHPAPQIQPRACSFTTQPNKTTELTGSVAGRGGGWGEGHRNGRYVLYTCPDPTEHMTQRLTPNVTPGLELITDQYPPSVQSNVTRVAPDARCQCGALREGRGHAGTLCTSCTGFQHT